MTPLKWKLVGTLTLLVGIVLAVLLRSEPTVAWSVAAAFILASGACNLRAYTGVWAEIRESERRAADARDRS